ncbi:carboxypeptidase M32 [Patescibacteria group bacterium]|jgi:carboxypeptidase Taq|nr:carboxypeptidase M32 [Patescibacteria group bacterium]
MSYTPEVTELIRRLREAAHLRSAASLLAWDQETKMPAGGAEARAETLAFLAGLAHQRVLAIDADGLLTDLHRKLEKRALKGKAAVIVRAAWRDVSRTQRLPEEHVRTWAAATSRAQHVWARARAADDFAAFQPHLAEVVALARQRAHYLDPDAPPYDVLLDTFEPGMTADTLAALFSDLRAELVPFAREVVRAARTQRPKPFPGRFPTPVQERYAWDLARAIGLDPERGRLDASVHPFTQELHPSDVRITTRYNDRDPWDAIGSTIHETGHALYEQGLPEQAWGTALGETESLALHESQSRFFENMVGRDRQFWNHHYPRLKKVFAEGLAGYSLNDWMLKINAVKKHPIRVEADEVTYNLHIMLRFELEQALVEGAIDVTDLPHLWRQRANEYLGLSLKSDRDGVLQDVHWSCGLFGYFPTYTLGTLYAAGLDEAIRRDIPERDELVARGDLCPLLAWLRRNIHRHGRRYPAETLIKKVTGAGISIAPFMRHLTDRYGALYKL